MQLAMAALVSMNRVPGLGRMTSTAIVPDHPAIYQEPGEH
jgi:hypothetical protein